MQSFCLQVILLTSSLLMSLEVRHIFSQSYSGLKNKKFLEWKPDYTNFLLLFLFFFFDTLVVFLQEIRPLHNSVTLLCQSYNKQQWNKMNVRNRKNMMKLVRLPILRPLMFNCQILWWLGNWENQKDLFAGWQNLSSSNFFPIQICFIFKTFKPPWKIYLQTWMVLKLAVLLILSCLFHSCIHFFPQLLFIIDKVRCKGFAKGSCNLKHLPHRRGFWPLFHNN